MRWDWGENMGEVGGRLGGVKGGRGEGGRDVGS